MVVHRIQDSEKRMAAHMAMAVLHGAGPLVNGKVDGLKQYLRSMS